MPREIRCSIAPPRLLRRRREVGGPARASILQNRATRPAVLISAPVSRPAWRLHARTASVSPYPHGGRRARQNPNHQLVDIPPGDPQRRHLLRDARHTNRRACVLQDRLHPPPRNIASPSLPGCCGPLALHPLLVRFRGKKLHAMPQKTLLTHPHQERAPPGGLRNDSGCRCLALCCAQTQNPPFKSRRPWNSSVLVHSA